MESPSDRLKQARRDAGYRSAAAAARAMGVPSPTYSGHENGYGAKITREPFERYARFFRVNLEWLLTGKGEKRGAASIRVYGYVTAGAAIEEPAADGADFVDLPNRDALGAYEVEGDSMWPRFMPGEFVLFDRRALLPREIVDQYAIVQTLDGRRMVKILRKGRDENRWRLESHNAPPVENVELLAAWRYCGVLPPGALIMPADATKARSSARRKPST